MRGPRHRRLLLAIAVAFAVTVAMSPALVGAQTDPTTDTAPPDTSPPDTAPPDTSPPDTEAPDTSDDPATDGSDDSSTDDGDDLDVVPILIVAGIGAVAIAVLAGVWGSLKRGSGRRNRFKSLMVGARSRAQWLHDSLSVELSNRALDDQPQMLQRSWAEGQRHITDLSAELHGIAAQATSSRHRTAVLSLAAAVEALSGALSTDVSLRSSGPTDDAARLAQRAESTQTVAVRRAELANAIEATRSLS